MKPGQPSAKSKLSYETQEKIIQAIRGSQTFECAAALAGIDRTTLNDWRYRGQQEPGSRYASFNKALEQALLESEAALVKAIVTDPDWKAKKWILKNRFPDRYKERVISELSGPGGAPIPIDSTAHYSVEIICPGAERDDPIIESNGNGSHDRASAPAN